MASPKGDYKPIPVDEEKATGPSRNGSISQAPLGLRAERSLADQILNHPALPVASYCVASILMTVSVCSCCYTHSELTPSLLQVINSACSPPRIPEVRSAQERLR